MFLTLCYKEFDMNEKESVEDKEIVDSYVDAMMLMYKEYEVSKNES